MIASITEYQSLLKRTFKKASTESLLKFAIKVAERLFEKYHFELSNHGFYEEAEMIKDDLAILTAIANRTKDYADDMLEMRLTQLYMVGYSTTSNLDLSEVYQLGIHQLINALEFCYAFLLDAKPMHIVGCACCPFKVIKLILVREDIDMTGADQYFSHPTFMEELHFQSALLKELGITIDQLFQSAQVAEPKPD